MPRDSTTFQITSRGRIKGVKKKFSIILDTERRDDWSVSSFGFLLYIKR